MKIFNVAKKSKALKDSAMMVAGNTFASGISAVALIVFSRYLGPEKYGIFSVGFSTVLLIAKLADGGINVAVQRNLSKIFEKNKNEANSYIKVGTIYKLILSTILVIGLLIFSKPISIHWLKTDQFSIVRYAIVLALINILYDYVGLLLQSFMMFKDYIIMNVSQATSKVVSAFALLLLNISDPLIAFITYAACPIIGCFYGIMVMPTWIVSKVKPTKTQFQAINKILKYTSIAIIVGAISDNIDVLMVKSFLSNYETGLYSAGARLSMLVSILGYSLGTVLNPRVSRYKSKDQFKKYVPKALLISAIALIGTILSLPLAKPLLLITAGGEYIEAVTTVKYLLAAGFVVLATTPFVSMFYVVEKTQYFAIRGVIQMIVLITANLLLIPKFGIVGAGMARLITRITAFAFTAIYAGFAVRQQYKINFAKEFREIKNI